MWSLNFAAKYSASRFNVAALCITVAGGAVMGGVTKNTLHNKYAGCFYAGAMYVKRFSKACGGKALNTLLVNFCCKFVVKRGAAIVVFGVVFTRNNGYIHYPAAAFFAKIGRLLHTVPKPAVVHTKVACLHVKARFPAVGIVVDKVFFAKKQF